MVIALVALALALRLPGIFTDFWLDEIWSYDIARGLHSLKDIVFSEPARIDNNHFLNTLFLWLIGDVRQWWIYRIPSLCFGVGSVVMAARIMRRSGALEMNIAAILMAFSFPFVFYSSEARGYSMVVFFALLAMEALLSDKIILFNLACILGFCSHLTFVHFYFAAMIWSVLRVRRSVWRWLGLNAAPLVFCGLLYRFFVRDITIGGAAPREPLDVLVESLATPLGFPAHGMLAWVGVTIAIGLFIGAMVMLARRRDPIWIFNVLAVAVAPLFFCIYNRVLSERPQPLMLRYFLVAIAMMLLAISLAIAELFRTGPPGRVIASVLLAACCAANLVKLFEFHRFGRGGYTHAITRAIETSPDATVTMAADSEFRVGQVIDFYAKRIVPKGRSIDFYRDRRTEDAPRPPQWLVLTKPADIQLREPIKVLDHGEVYALDSEYPSRSPSGTSWLLYRLDVNATLKNQLRQ